MKITDILKNFDIPEEQKAALIIELREWALEMVGEDEQPMDAEIITKIELMSAGNVTRDEIINHNLREVAVHNDVKREIRQRIEEATQ